MQEMLSVSITPGMYSTMWPGKSLLSKTIAPPPRGDCAKIAFFCSSVQFWSSPRMGVELVLVANDADLVRAGDESFDVETGWLKSCCSWPREDC